MKLPYMKAPCSNCPFRKDTMKGWLGRERMKGILESGSFTCHKTTGRRDEDLKQCAGHMLMLGEDSAFVQVAKRFGTPVQLKDHDRVFESKQQCIDHHSTRRELEQTYDK